jgi:hypothetical protein
VEHAGRTWLLFCAGPRDGEYRSIQGFRYVCGKRDHGCTATATIITAATITTAAGATASAAAGATAAATASSPTGATATARYLA